ncbi:hypothetical protein CPCC7001_2212 [Cyanobium sp. PCC 7001]|nr:hypothetical protein CPCC7001_2212 [Cyanobium sp. PCC 7001]
MFVLAPHGQLPSGNLDWPALVAAQAAGVRQARRLRIFTSPEDDGNAPGLEALIDQLENDSRPFCNALVPELEIGALSLGVYELQGSGEQGERRDQPVGHPADSLQLEALRCLDEVPLAEVANEACWFYPTDAGTYLACSTAADVQQLPGHQPERADEAQPLAYRRDELRLLWSLLGGDDTLTCVGLTYGGQRIDWPLVSERPDQASTWTRFAVDPSSEHAYRELEQRVLPT